MIHVVFLAQLREQLGISALDVPHTEAKTINELKEYLMEKNPFWQTALSNMKLLVAVNHAYAKNNASLVDGDEVAFFPPVTGG